MAGETNAKVVGGESSKPTEGSGDHDDDNNHGDEKDGDYDDQNSENDPQNNEYSYHDEYYGGEGQGFEFNNNNGEQTGTGYNYNYGDGNPPMNQPMINGQSYEFKGGFPSNGGGFPSNIGGGVGGGVGGGGFPNFPNYMGQQQGFVSYDDGATADEVGNYEKKHELKAKNKKNGMKKLNEVRHKHNVGKAKKLISTKLREENAYRRTIMIGKP